MVACKYSIYQNHYKPHGSEFIAHDCHSVKETDKVLCHQEMIMLISIGK